MKNLIYTYSSKCFTVLFFILLFFQSCKTNRTEWASDKILITSDTTEIEGWALVPGKQDEGDAYKVMRNNNKWMLSPSEGEFAEADTGYIRRSVKHIINFRAITELNIAEQHWDTLGLTDKGTKLLIYKNGNVAQELIIGKMFFREGNKATYYVRRKGEDEVYTIPLYLDGSLKAPVSKFRKKDFVLLAPQQISEIKFLTPEGIDFVLKRAGQNNWSIDGILTNDSAARIYTSALSKLQITNFGEKPETGADLAMEIAVYNKPSVWLRAFRKNSDTWIVISSDNEGNYMETSLQNIQLLFPGKAYFMQAMK